MEKYGLMEYGFVEAVDFVGVMPEAAEKIGVTGSSDVIVEAHGHMANGMDAIEVVDIEKVF
jgi:hypothetical protein